MWRPPTRRFAIWIATWCSPALANCFPSAAVCIEDIFLGRPEGKLPFDAYWATSIGPITEYEEAAEIHGFVMDRNEDVTSRTMGRWYWSIAWAQARLTELETTGRLTADTELRLLRSIREHARLASCFHNGVYKMRITRFRRVR
jgi:hypothetical protein